MIENVEVQQAIPFLPMLITGLLRAGGAGISAFSNARSNRRDATAAALRRNRFNSLIEKIRNRDTSGVDAQASQVFSQASDQIDANAAQRGTLRAPNAGAPRQRNETFSSILAQLGQARAADQRQAQQMIGTLLGDEAYGVPSPENFNPLGAGLVAGLGGFAGGAGETFNNFLGTDAGIGLMGGGGSGFTGFTPQQVRFNDQYQNRNMGR